MRISRDIYRIPVIYFLQAQSSNCLGNISEGDSVESSPLKYVYVSEPARERELFDLRTTSVSTKEVITTSAPRTNNGELPQEE